MIQYCQFTRIGQTAELICGICKSIVASTEDNIRRICDIPAEDPPERDPSTLPCRWRGELIRREAANVAGTRGESVSVYQCGAAGTGYYFGSISPDQSECTLEPKLNGVHSCLGCRARDSLGSGGPPEPAPLRNVPIGAHPWEGMCPRRPWEYDVTVAIPVLDTIGPLPVILDLLRLQTIRPFIVLIDTGSQPETVQALEAMRADDLEVHRLHLNGFSHSSESVSMAMDVAFAVCRTPYMFCTHTDVFLKRRDVLEEMIGLCQTQSPVVGYQMSPRPHDDWPEMVGHSCTMLDMREMWDKGITWSMRRGMQLFGLECGFHTECPNWPDTEVGFNYVLWRAGIKAHLIGTEENGKVTDDDRMTHCRSLPASAIYAPSIHEEMTKAADKAVAEGKARVAAWEAAPHPFHAVKLSDLSQYKRMEPPTFTMTGWVKRRTSCLPSL